MPTISECIERARKILQFEQRTNHQDQAIKPGGLEVFAARWAEDTSNACKNASVDVAPVHSFMEYMVGYRKQDPMQRAASIRSALAILNDMDGGGNTSRVAHFAQEQKKAHAQEEQPTTRHIGKVPAEEKTISKDVSAQPKSTQSSAQTQKAGVEPIKPASPRLSQTQKAVQTQSTTSQSIRLEAGMTQGHTVMTLLTADVTAVPGVGPSVATRLHTLGIRTVRDLLFYFPREHRDYSKLEKIASIPFNELVTTVGMIWEVEDQAYKMGGRSITVATISDDTGKLRVSWFNQGYLQKQLLAAKGSYLVVTGTKQRFGNKVEFSVRTHELPDQGDLLNTGRLVPTYPLTEGLPAKTLRRFTKWVVDRYAAMVPDYLPPMIRSAGQLLPLPDAISHIHYPESEEMLTAARRRLAFDELFLIQLGMQERRSRWKQQVAQGNAFSVDLTKVFVDEPASSQKATVVESQPMGTTLWSTVTTQEPFEATLPYRFTDAQHHVLNEIFQDLERTQPMCRLLQGDVGAGKTAVAAAALYMAAINGYQGAIMAPTELLAEQHARSIGAMLEPFGIRTVLLTGSLKQRERTMGRTALENGEAMVAIGTHALIQEDVTFSKTRSGNHRRATSLWR